MKQEKLLREIGGNATPPPAYDSSSQVKMGTKGGQTNHDMHIFSFGSIATATDNFSSVNKLGEGGYGPVYKAWQLWIEGRASELIDPILGGSCSPNEVLRCIHIGLLCVQEKAADRPSMLDVVSFLSSEIIQLAQPNQPAFFNVKEPDVLHVNHDSLNVVTISDVNGR
ncbi:putative Receptor protein kinase [Quillaja saponaria]|uniref:Receptor protein kinase n=1 Tax=Quillaja saponaria TaxID=32244 RepID=A0AAD7LRQ5_QUISA|nr:putative Receptor protein kinase [Quillaja saponaria]